MIIIIGNVTCNAPFGALPVDPKANAFIHKEEPVKQLLFVLCKQESGHNLTNIFSATTVVYKVTVRGGRGGGSAGGGSSRPCFDFARAVNGPKVFERGCREETF